MPSSTAVVIGGGIAGILASKLLSQRGISVHLHEASPRLGGFLRGPTFNDVVFPPGPIFFHEHHIEEINEYLYKNPNCPWKTCETYQPGQLTDNSQLDTKTDSLNLTSLPISERTQCVLSLLYSAIRNKKNKQDTNTAFEYLSSKGVTKPVLIRISSLLYQKYRLDMREIPIEILQGIITARIKLFRSTNVTNILKSIPNIDKLVADSCYRSRANSSVIHPQFGNFNQWLDHLEHDLISSGVEIHKNSKLSKHYIDDSQVENKLSLLFETNKGTYLHKPEFTFTSIPIFSNSQSRPKLASNQNSKAFSIYIETKHPLSLKNTYINIYDPSTPFTRLTPTRHKQDRTGCILEGISESYTDTNAIQTNAIDFLVLHQFINRKDEILNCNIITRPNTFLTAGKSSEKHQLPQTAIPIGRLNNSLLFTKDLLSYTYKQINESLENSYA